MSKLPPMSVEKSKKLPAGTYEGRVLGWDVSTRDVQGKPVTYADFNVAVRERAGEEPVVLVAGYPIGRLTEDSYLGKLLQRFGKKLDLGTELDMDKELDSLVGRDVSVRIFVEKKPQVGGAAQEFSRIDRDSMRPAASK